MSQPNRRILFTSDSKFAIAPREEGKPVTLTGYAIVWDVLSSDRGGYHVRLKPGSAKFLEPTLALFHHDTRCVIGNTANKTLRLMPDDYGVKVEIDLPDTTTGRDVAELVGKGYVGGMSFAMVSSPEGTTNTDGGQTIMDVTEFECDEVTVTAIPSFTETTIEVKGGETPDDETEEDEGTEEAEAEQPAEPPADFAARTQQSLQLHRFKLSNYTL